VSPEHFDCLCIHRLNYRSLYTKLNKKSCPDNLIPSRSSFLRFPLTDPTTIPIPTQYRSFAAPPTREVVLEFGVRRLEVFNSLQDYTPRVDPQLVHVNLLPINSPPSLEDAGDIEIPAGVTIPQEIANSRSLESIVIALNSLNLSAIFIISV
jgi:hypothetical protein